MSFFLIVTTEQISLNDATSQYRVFTSKNVSCCSIQTTPCH